MIDGIICLKGKLRFVFPKILLTYLASVLTYIEVNQF